MELVTGKTSLQNALDDSSAFLSARYRYQAHAVMRPPVIILLSVGFVIALMPCYAPQNTAPLPPSAWNANRLRPHDNWRYDLADCSLHCISASTANMLDLGDGRSGRFHARRRIYRAGIHRATLQYVQTDYQSGNQKFDPCNGPSESNSGQTSV